MENHTKYGAAIYFPTADELYVNLFIPYELHYQLYNIYWKLSRRSSVARPLICRIDAVTGLRSY